MADTPGYPVRIALPDATPLPPDPETVANRQRLISRMTAARQQGASWDAIHQVMAERVQAARQAGASDAAIQKTLGFNSPEELIANTQASMQQHLAATKPTSWTEAFVSGLTHSSTAALLGVTPRDAPIQGGHARQLTAVVGESLGDLPESLLGGVLGGIVGAAGGGAVGAVAGGGPEDIPADIAGAGLGAYAGSAAGAAAVPQLIKSERDRYMQALVKGQVAGPEDYLHIQAQVARDTAEAAGVGLATAGVGKAVGPLLDKMGAGKVTKFIATAGAESATMATAQAALAGHMPTVEDVVDAAVTVGAFHVASKATTATYHAIRTRIVQEHVDSGRPVPDIANDAVNDPVFRAKIMGIPDPVVPPGSSHTSVTPPHMHGPGQMSGPHTPMASDVYIIPRIAGDFDHAVAWMFKEEGGLTTDTGGRTNWGISSNAHPGVNVEHLSKDDAAGIYHREYWRGIDADALPPNMRLAAFDSAVNQGVGQTKTWLREAGGDLQAFMRLRLEKYAQLARDPKYAKYAASWARRMKDLGASDAMAGIVHRGPDNVGREFSPDDKATLGLDIDGEGGKPPKPPSGGDEPPDFTPGDDGAFDRVKSAVASDEGTDWFGGTIHAFGRVYGELFNPLHPVSKLYDAVTKGEPLDDYRNPNLLFRVAENANTVAKGAISGGRMVDLDGNHTGPSLEDIYTGKSVGEKFTKAQSKDFLDGYAVAKWALMMHAQGKNPAGIHAEDAQKVVNDYEHGGIMPAGEDIPDLLQRAAIALEYVDKNSKKLKGSPHYNIKTSKIVLPQMTDAEYRAAYGPNLGHDEVLAHETGHAIAYTMSKEIGKGDWSFLPERVQTLLEDELHVASRRFRPEFWEKTSDQKNYVRKSNELMADAMATWLTDPVARTRMPFFRKVIEEAMSQKQGEPFNLGDTLGAVPEKYGTPFQQAFDHLVNWRNQTAEWLRDGEVNSSESYRKWVADNDASIPGYRRMDDGTYKPVSTGKPGIWNPIKTAKGSERQIEPILKSLQQDAFLRRQLAENNRAMVATADMGLMGNKAEQKRAVNFNVAKAMDMLKDRGIDEDMMSGLATATGMPLLKDEVPVFREGKMYHVKFEDPEITRVLRGYDQGARWVATKIAADISAGPRNMQTRFNPMFPLRLVTYDMLFQHVVNPDSKNVLASLYTGLGHMIGNTEAYQAWGQSGGADHIFANVSNDKFVQRTMQGLEEQSLASNMWNAAGTPFKALSAWARLVTTPIKAGRYIQGLEKGETPIRAAVASSEAALHRAAYGGPLSRAMNSLVYYWTAHLNGLEKTTRAQFGIGSTVTGVKYNLAATTAKGLIALTIPAVMSWFAYKDEPWYKAMPDWQKNNSLIIVPPIGGAPPIPIAAPPILSEIYVALPRMLMEAYYNDNPHAFDHFWGTMGGGLLPPGGLTGVSILQPLVEHLANHSFHKDTPLVSQDTIQGVQPAEQFNQYSSPAARDLAQFTSDLPLVHSNLGWSPAVIDNYINQWGSVPGRTIAAGADKVLASSPANAYPETKVSEWPGVSSWSVRYPSANAEPIQQFYDTARRLNQEHGSLLKEMRDSNFAAFKRIVDQGGPSAAAYHQMNLGQNAPPNVDLSPYFDYLDHAAAKADYGNLALVHQASDALKSAHEWSLQNVSENPSLTSHDKRQILDMVNAQMQAISERGNEAMDRALIGVKHPGSSARKPAPDSIEFVPPEVPGQ